MTCSDFPKNLANILKNANYLFFLGDYEISAQPEQIVDLMVIDTKGQHFVNRENTENGKFAFTTDDYDVFEICFLSR